MLKLLSFLLLTSALAAPIADPEPRAATSPSKPFTLTIAHNRHKDLNGKAINAEDLALFLGLASPSTYCPSPDPIPANECPAGNETVFDGLLSMDVEVPGGQLAYVGPDGAVGYTQAHSAEIPPGSFTQGFAWSPLHTNSVLGERGSLNFIVPGATSGGFFACAGGVPSYVPGATYRIYAKVPGFVSKDCIDLGELRTTEYKAAEFGAWQYT